MTKSLFNPIYKEHKFYLNILQAVKSIVEKHAKFISNSFLLPYKEINWGKFE